MIKFEELNLQNQYEVISHPHDYATSRTVEKFGKIAPTRGNLQEIKDWNDYWKMCYDEALELLKKFQCEEDYIKCYQKQNDADVLESTEDADSDQYGYNKKHSFHWTDNDKAKMALLKKDGFVYEYMGILREANPQNKKNFAYQKLFKQIQTDPTMARSIIFDANKDKNKPTWRYTKEAKDLIVSRIHQIESN